MALYVVNLFLRGSQGYGTDGGVALSVAGMGLLSISGWLGGELVYVYGVAVEGRAEGREPAGQHR